MWVQGEGFLGVRGSLQEFKKALGCPLKCIKDLYKVLQALITGPKT